MKDINIKYYPADDLVMAEYNPRQLTKDQYTQLKDSIMRFGLVDPLIVNKNKERKNILVGGHQRLRIAKEMGVESIPCVEVDLTLDQEKELNIRLNKNVGEWDFDALANYFDVGELTEWGFSDDDLQFYEDEPKQGLIDDDEIPEVEEPITQAGDLWILGEHRLLCGDATKKEDVDLLMDGKKADMVFTDPPWNVNYGENLANGKYKDRKIINDSMSTEDFKSFINQSFISLKNSSKEGCMTYIVMSAQEWGNLMLTLKENDYHWSSTIIWNKSSLIISRKDYHTKYEPIWYGWLNGESRLKPLKDRKQSDVWDIQKPSSSKLHPTTKPIELVERAVINSSYEKNIIIDVFLGSGSTLIACEKTNRKCYGMEIDPHYCDVIVKRWEEFSGKKAERVERAES
jgi:DNA modification methylase